MSRLQPPWSPGYLLGLLSARGWNIAFRTAHIAATAVLLGGHVFDRPPEVLLPSLYLSLGTGAALAVSEAGPGWLWFHQLRGLMTMVKVGLMCFVPVFWNYRVPILLAVVVIASVGSHMPARFRYYSVLYREIIRGSCGPGVAQLEADAAGDEIDPADQET